MPDTIHRDAVAWHQEIIRLEKLRVTGDTPELAAAWRQAMDAWKVQLARELSALTGAS